MLGSHGRRPGASPRRYGSRPHLLLGEERAAIRRLMQLLGVSARDLAAAIYRSHTHVNDVLAGVAELTPAEQHGLDAKLSAVAREAVSTASVCADPGAVFAGVGTRVLSTLEAATAELLVALQSPDPSMGSARFRVSGRTLRSWLSCAAAADAAALGALVTHATCHRVHPWLEASRPAEIDLGEVKRLLDEAFETDERGAVWPVVLDAKLRALLARPEASSPEPTVLGLQLDGLTLDASHAAEPRAAWLRLRPGESVPLGTFVGTVRRWDLRIERSRRDFFDLDDERRHYEFTWCVYDRAFTNSQAIATLSYKPKPSRPALASLRLVLHGGAFAAGIAEQLRAELLTPVAIQRTVRIASAHVALDVACSYARVLERYRGKGRVSQVCTRSGPPFDTTYRRVGSKAAQLATYDRLAEEHDALYEEDWPRVRRARARYGGPNARIEMRLAGRFVERGLATVDGFLDGVIEEFARNFDLVDLHAAVARASPLEAFALRLIAARGHDRLEPPRTAASLRRNLANGGTKGTKASREPSRNEVIERASHRIVSALREAGVLTKRARAIGTRWHHAATERLAQLAEEEPLFDDLAVALSAHDGSLRIQLARLVDGTQPDVDELVRPENRAAFDAYMRELERVADRTLLEEATQLAVEQAVIARRRSPLRSARSAARLPT